MTFPVSKWNWSRVCNKLLNQKGSWLHLIYPSQTSLWSSKFKLDVLALCEKMIHFTLQQEDLLVDHVWGTGSRATDLVQGPTLVIKVTDTPNWKHYHPTTIWNYTSVFAPLSDAEPRLHLILCGCVTFILEINNLTRLTGKAADGLRLICWNKTKDDTSFKNLVRFTLFCLETASVCRNNVEHDVLFQIIQHFIV